MSLPDSRKVYMQLLNAINKDSRPADLFYGFLASGRAEGNFIANNIQEYKHAILLLTSSKGRQWMHKHLDDTLNYLQKLAES